MLATPGTALQEDNSTDVRESQAPVLPFFKRHGQGSRSARPVGLGLDHAAIMGRHGAKAAAAIPRGGHRASGGGPQAPGTALRFPGAPSGGGGDGRGAGEKLRRAQAQETRRRANLCYLSSGARCLNTALFSPFMGGKRGA